MSYFRTFIIPFLFFFPLAVTGRPAVYLKPETTDIVTSSSPDDFELKSAALLGKWLQYIYKTDSGFVIVKDKVVQKDSGKIFIAIGHTRLTVPVIWDKQEPYSFRISVKDNVIMIQGATSFGTLLAVNYFLDHVGGIRFYLPGELFISEPTVSKINVDKIKTVYEIPFAKYVYSTGYTNYSLENYKSLSENNWAQTNALQRKDWGSHQHSMGDRFFDTAIFRLFPEIFPVIKGKRYFPASKQDQQWEPDFMEPTLVDAAVYSTIQYFKLNPAIDYISFSVQDSYVYPEEGKIGAYLKNYPDTREGKKRAYTNAFVEFLNKLATRLEKELPANGITKAKTIVYIAYGYVSYMPLVKLHPMILPVTVMPLAGAVKYLVLNDTGIVKKWSAVTRRIGNHDWAEGKGFIYPRIYTNLVAEYLKTIKRNGMRFEYAHIESYPNWSLDGPKYYFMSKLYWNPEVSPDSLLTLFCKDMFGKVGKFMKAYFTTLENLNTSMNNDPAINRSIGGYLTQLPLNVNELSLLKQARKYLDKAYTSSKVELCRKRVAFFSKGFKISEGFFGLYNSKIVDANKVTELKEYLKNEVAGNPMMLNWATQNGFTESIQALADQVIKAKK